MRYDENKAVIANAPVADESLSPVSEKETTRGLHFSDDSAVDGLEKQVRSSLTQDLVPEMGGRKQPAGSSKSGAGKVTPEPAPEDKDVLETLEFPSAGRLMDSLYSMASWVMGKKFRPGRSIDLMPHFTPKEHERLKDIAGVVKQLKEERRYPFMAHLMGSGGEMFVSHSSGLYTGRRGLPFIRTGPRRRLHDKIQKKAPWRKHGSPAKSYRKLQTCLNPSRVALGSNPI